ncbi:PQQ-binding-like beta-propeller repeat protein, partial [Myxococcota bacterium]|nr:PQQ-binding-like beta-propeller repeat protein [Myxococcota bacterium]
LHWSRRNETLSGFTVKGHSAPVIDGKLLYMGLSDGRLQALDITRRGTLVWSKTLENPDKENYIDSDADPLIDGDTLYTASYRNGVVALEKDSGDLLWKFPAYGVTSLSIVRDHIYFVSPRDGIHCLTLSGKLVWKQHVDYGTPKKLLIRGRRMFIAFDLGGLIAIDPVTGFFFQRFDTGAGISGNPSIHGNRLATFANNGKLYLFQIK